MAEDVYGLTREQMARLKQLLAAFETGRLNADAVPRKPPLPGPQWTLLGKTDEIIPAAVGADPGEGVVNRWKYDVEEEEYADEDAIVDEEELVCEAFNPTASAIAADSWVGLIRDPWSGRYWALPYGGGITVEEEDGTPAISGVTTLRFDEDFGMVVTDLTSGVAGVHVRFATATEAGVVSITTQTFAGDKTFEDDVIVEGSFISSDGADDRVVMRFKDGAGSDGYVHARGQTGSPDYSGRKTLATFTNGVILAEWSDLAETTNYDSGFAARNSSGAIQTGASGTVGGLTFYGGLYVSGSSIAWADITGEPTTLAGYGITDAASSSHTHTFASLTSKPTTLAGYGITDATLTDLAGVTWTAMVEEFIYRNSTGTYVLGTLTSAGRALIDDADAAAQRVTLEIGVGVPAGTGSSGTAGQMAYDGTYFYVCVSASSWGRVALDFGF